MNDELILSDPEIMGGTPCIRGTRITVYAIEARLNGGESIGDLTADYPYVTAEQFRAAIAYAARVPFSEDPDGRPWRKTKARTGAK